MDLLYADVLLQQVACYLKQWAVMTTPEREASREKITNALNQAAELVTTVGYERRQAILIQLQNAARETGASFTPIV
jgi:hypothetical protein